MPPHLSVLPKNTIGFCYYPDTLHYREQDLYAWLPRLIRLHAAWLVLRAPINRSIPEKFLRSLNSAGIQPILQFEHPPIDASASLASTGDNLLLLLENYARWGINYVVFFDRPNLRLNWPAGGWVQQDLVERFLDYYLPLAENAQEMGLTPVFPGLEPGGDYWDTAFLSAALHGLKRRGSATLLSRLVIGAYAWTFYHPVDWGAGGPEHWPQARPYTSDPETQDQRGMRIIDWYLAFSHSILGYRLPVILLAAGSRPSSPVSLPTLPLDPDRHTYENLAILRTMCFPSSTASIEGQYLLACNFWLLASGANSPYTSEAWFQEDNSSLPIVEFLHTYWESGKALPTQPNPTSIEEYSTAGETTGITGNVNPHYLLLPPESHNSLGKKTTKLETYLRQWKPKIGFSISEATRAERVTLLGVQADYPQDWLTQLLHAGCTVEWMQEDGTILASKIAQPSEVF